MLEYLLVRSTFGCVIRFGHCRVLLGGFGLRPLWALCGGLLPPLPSHNTRRLAVFGGGATLPLATRKPTRAKARGSGGGVVP